MRRTSRRMKGSTQKQRITTPKMVIISQKMIPLKRTRPTVNGKI
ncbi:hypothetical protein [Glutamicibacter mysorens]|nr:hypothetical protein [Glutamicibacter mysorens]